VVGLCSRGNWTLHGEFVDDGFVKNSPLEKSTMERFLKQYQSQITGVLSGPDRVLFRGVLRSISYVKGLEIFLSSIRVLNRDFMAYAERVSKSICEHAQRFAERYGRPYEYVASSRASKEDIARKISVRDQIQEGLVCVLDEGSRYRALRPISPEDNAKLVLLQDGRFAIDGIRNRDLQGDWPDPAPNDADGRRTAGRITRWLRLLVAHGLLSKVPRTQCYRLTLKGQAVITCAVRLRNADMQKLVA
jgi:hypothetical protein